MLVLVRVEYVFEKKKEEKGQTELEMPLGLVGNEVDYTFCDVICVYP
jgi:hypothetical protein